MSACRRLGTRIRNLPLYAISSAGFDGAGIARFMLLAALIQAAMASCASRIAAASVLPHAEAPGRSGATANYPPLPRREFLHVDDMADARVFLMEPGFSEGICNIGAGEDVTIRELAETIQRVVGFEGDLVFDASKPDGTPRKLLDRK